MTEKREQFNVVQVPLGHVFNDVELLRQALTHPSYAHEHPDVGGEERHNQRLEFLGDAVLDFLVASWLYREYPDFPEGTLTRLRATLVQTTTLARLARELEVGEALLLGHGEEEGGGRQRDATLCDAMEALVGALYLDASLSVVEERLLPWFAREAHAILAAESYVDAKSRLQEWAQAETGITPTYRITDEQGPNHAKVFTAEVLLEERVVGEGVGSSKRSAEQAAAQEALHGLTL